MSVCFQHCQAFLFFSIEWEYLTVVFICIVLISKVLKINKFHKIMNFKGHLVYFCRISGCNLCLFFYLVFERIIRKIWYLCDTQSSCKNKGYFSLVKYTSGFFRSFWKCSHRFCTFGRLFLSTLFSLLLLYGVFLHH